MPAANPSTEPKETPARGVLPAPLRRPRAVGFAGLRLPTWLLCVQRRRPRLPAISASEIDYSACATDDSADQQEAAPERVFPVGWRRYPPSSPRGAGSEPTDGSGEDPPSRVTARSCAWCDGEGQLRWRAWNGTIFDSSYTGQPIKEFPLNQVVKGWGYGWHTRTSVIPSRLVIPSSLGYGFPGKRASIPANSAFVVDILAASIQREDRRCICPDRRDCDRRNARRYHRVR